LPDNTSLIGYSAENQYASYLSALGVLFMQDNLKRVNIYVDRDDKQQFQYVLLENLTESIK